VLARVFRIGCLMWLGLARAAPTPAHAEPRTDAGLRWQAPASCPDAGEVRARIERRLGVAIDRVVHGIEVEITGASAAGDGAPGYVARIDLRGITVENEVRVLTSPRCDELTDAVAVIIVRLATESRALAIAPPGAPVIAPPAAGPAASRAWSAGLRVLGLSGIGAIPRVGTGGELGVFVRHLDRFMELAEARWLPSGAVLFPNAPGRVDVSLDVTALRFGWGPEDLPLRAWIGGELGSIDGQGVALGDNRLGSGLWIGGSAGVGVAWPVTPRARVVGTFELAVPFHRARFVLLDGGQVFRPDPAAARAGLGLELGWQ
jgi:hypothetical protein